MYSQCLHCLAGTICVHTFSHLLVLVYMRVYMHVYMCVCIHIMDLITVADIKYVVTEYTTFLMRIGGPINDVSLHCNRVV